MTDREKIFLILSSIFIASLIMANIIGITKIITVFGIGIPIGVIPYPITFLATDLISELYGKKTCKLPGLGRLCDEYLSADCYNYRILRTA